MFSREIVFQFWQWDPAASEIDIKFAELNDSCRELHGDRE